MMEEEEGRKFDSIGEGKEPLRDIIDLTAASTSPPPSSQHADAPDMRSRERDLRKNTIEKSTKMNTNSRQPN